MRAGKQLIMGQNRNILRRKVEDWQQIAAESAYRRTREMGTLFEKVCQVYLQHDPTEQKTFGDVLTWPDWARKYRPDDPDEVQDTGIDLMAQLRHHPAKWRPVQCKLMAGKGRTISQGEMGTFLSKSASVAECEGVLIMDATGRTFSRNLASALRGRQPSQRTLKHLADSAIEWDEWFEHGGVTVEERAPKVPRTYQTEAIQDVVAGLQEVGSRGKMIMACGTGKTFTSLCIARELVGCGGMMLYLVPSLALMDQTVHAWVEDSAPEDALRAFSVCSDTQVGKRKVRGDFDMAEHELEYPATTDAYTLTRQVQSGNQEAFTVVFATYQSVQVLHQAQQEHGLGDFGLVICDEAHRTCGVDVKDKEASKFVRIHDQDYIRADRRLYMTATPKQYTVESKRAAAEVGIKEVDMGDTAIYGEELYKIGFQKAINEKVLADFRMVCFTLTESVAALVQEVADEYELSLDDGGKLIGCWRALAKVDAEEFAGDEVPMRRMIAYCNTIKKSRAMTEAFGPVRQAYLRLDADAELAEQGLQAKHVDGGFSAAERRELLDWLSRLESGADTGHVLFNCRCLSEGVDVPALDGIMFMEPRGSKFEIAQAIGRVLRKPADGEKQFGYIVVPVIVPDPDGVTEESLTSNRAFRTVAQVAACLREHDETFEAEINLLERGRQGKRIKIVGLTAKKKAVPGSPAGAKQSDDVTAQAKQAVQQGEQLSIPFESVELARAIRAKLARTVGSRVYWEKWAGDVADITRKHTVRIQSWIDRSVSNQRIFSEFVAEMRDDLNKGITKEDARDMLASHMVTGPVFNALLGTSEFAEQNPISKGMGLVLRLLEPEGTEWEAERASLQRFYDSVARRAEAAQHDSAKRQALIKDLYDNFFQKASPKAASKLGIVYTPVELVDFILYSVDEILRDEFGQSLSSEGVEILDPFTGTGTFITRMIQNGLIDQNVLPRKYRSEIHANEIMLLAYYIAAVNIEEAYHAMVGTDKYERFPGIILTDTFEMQDSDDMIAEILPENSKQIERQKKADIQVIVGNPPWSVGQRSENDAAQNQEYPILNRRVENSYVHHSSTGLKKSLYDSYILAVRWASDRIGESGVIGVVTNAGWLEGNAMDGMRKCLTDEFNSIYVLNLRGNARTQGDKRRAEGGNAFGEGSRAPVAITLLVRNPERKGCRILYHDIGDYLSREEKLGKVDVFRGIGGLEMQWTEIKPNTHNDWLNQRDTGFAEFMMLGDKRGQLTSVIFKNFSQGISTARDAWCYNYSKVALLQNTDAMVHFYERERARLSEQDLRGRRLTSSEITRFVNNDPAKISWSTDLKKDLAKNKRLSLEDGRIAESQYRPFICQNLFHSRSMNERVCRIPKIFPHEWADNLLICVTGKSVTRPFSVLMVKRLPDYQTMFNGQCFPRWLYSKTDERRGEMFGAERQHTDAHAYVRESAIKEEACRSFTENIGGGGISVTADDLFYYIYGVLHVPSYREKYAANLRRELPRIPFPKDAEEFHVLADAGRKLGELHVNYEDVKGYPISFEVGGWEPANGMSPEAWFRVEDRPMRHPGKGRQKDQSKIIYNGQITVQNIPEKAYDYVVNGKSAIAWVMERQRIKTDKKSGIVNDANRFAVETMQDPAYPLRLLAKVITVSLETVKVVGTLRDIMFQEAGQ